MNSCNFSFERALIYYTTLENYLYIIAQPEILTRNHDDPLERESQMRWDFMRAQSYQQVNRSSEAFHCFTLAYRTASLFDIGSVTQISMAELQLSTQSSTRAKIEILLIQLHEIKKREDFRVQDYIVYSLFELYLEEDDYLEIRRYTSEVPSSVFRNHTILLTDFFLAHPPSAQIHKLDGHENQPFCASGFLLSVTRESKWHTNLLRNNQSIAEKLKPILDTQIPDNLDVPILNLIMLSVKIMAHITAEDFEGAEQ